MKHIFFVFLLLTGVVFATEKKTESVESALSGLQKFEVITFFSPYDKIDQNAIHDSVAASFQQFGKISVSENESMLSSLLQLSPSFPICYYTQNNCFSTSANSKTFGRMLFSTFLIGSAGGIFSGKVPPISSITERTFFPTIS